MGHDGWTSQPIETSRNRRVGRTADTRGRICVQSWWEARTYGRVLLVLGILRLRGKHHAGISQAVEELARKGWTRFVKEATHEELRDSGYRIGQGFPGFRKYLALVEQARKTPKPTRSIYVRE